MISSQRVTGHLHCRAYGLCTLKDSTKLGLWNVKLRQCCCSAKDNARNVHIIYILSYVMFIFITFVLSRGSSLQNTALANTTRYPFMIF